MGKNKNKRASVGKITPALGDSVSIGTITNLSESFGSKLATSLEETITAISSVSFDLLDISF